MYFLNLLNSGLFKAPNVASLALASSKWDLKAVKKMVKNWVGRYKFFSLYAFKQDNYLS